MINTFVDEILEQSDPDRQIALSRKLRILLVDRVSQQDRDKATGWGILLPKDANALRRVKD